MERFNYTRRQRLRGDSLSALWGSALLEGFFKNNKDNVLAVVVEPIQGDAGIIVPPKWLSAKTWSSVSDARSAADC